MKNKNVCFTAIGIAEYGHDDCSYFFVEEHLTFLQILARLRNYIRSFPAQPHRKFKTVFTERTEISYADYIYFKKERMANSELVTGVFFIDLELDVVESMHNTTKQQTFRLRDVLTAAYLAVKEPDMSLDERQSVLLNYLDDKQTDSPPNPFFFRSGVSLTAEDISFCKDIVQQDYVMCFPMEQVSNFRWVFSTVFRFLKNDDHLTVYARYDLANRRLCSTLELFVVDKNGMDDHYNYRLSNHEKALLLPKMEDFSLQQRGQTLDQCCEDYQAELSQEIQL